jgi:CCR4-NOT transcription complex subunit 7/8
MQDLTSASTKSAESPPRSSQSTSRHPVSPEFKHASGLVLVEGVHWVCFHGMFDFAYLLKLLTGEDKLPADEYKFQEILALYFPSVYDVKLLAAGFASLPGSLAKLAEQLQASRVPDLS